MIKQKESKRYGGVENRVQLLAVILTLAFSGLLYQFWQLQIVRLHEFQQAAHSNSVREERLKSDRGVIYGRNNTVLADNRAGIDVVFVPGEVPEAEREVVVRRLAAILNVPADDLVERTHALRRAPFTQIAVKRDVARFDTVRVAERGFELPGVYTVVRPQRRYHYGETAGQILGFLGEISPAELKAWDGYHMGDLVGKAGVERMYEETLHGRDGHAVVTKYAWGRPQLRTDRRGVPIIAARDSHGHLLSEEAPRMDPESGSPVTLTLDIELQRFCEDLLKGELGAIAVINADTGAVLALASVPTYDPSVFVTRGRDRERLMLLDGGDTKPMRNRAYQEQYPPGSVYKIMLAAAALEEGIIHRGTTHFCPGSFRLSPTSRAWNCWRRSGHGTVAVVDALAFSCDVFFYNVGLQLGVDKINEWSNKMGLGVLTGIDLPGEVPGLVPNRAWKAALNAHKPVWEQNWYPGETVNLSIGQGSCSTTPLQNAVMTACIINDGYRVRPYLNAKLGPTMPERLFSDNTLEIVREGMRKCVQKGPPAPTGTGHRAHIAGVDVLGKTGTAQIMSLKHHERFKTEEDIPYRWRDHAWFVAGVADREPKIAICILVEHGHHGSSAASPFAKDIIEFFYANEAARNESSSIHLAREDR